MFEVPTWAIDALKWVLYAQLACGALLILGVMAWLVVNFWRSAWMHAQDLHLLTKACREYRERRRGDGGDAA